MSVLFFSLTWWQVGLVLVYSLYTLIRALWIFNAGLREAVLGDSEDIKLYHILWVVIDIPAIILGQLFPVLRMLFNIPVIPLKRKNQ